MSITVDKTLFNPVTTPDDPIDIQGLNTLMEDCIYMLPGCSDLMLRKELQKTFREFCRRTGALIVTDESSVTYEDYTMPLCKCDGEFYLLHRVKLNGVEVDATRYKLNKECGSVSIEFSLTEDEDDENGDAVIYAAEVKYSYVPRMGSEYAPAWFLTKYSDGIVAGTLFRLLAMPNKPWTDNETAKLQGLEYQRCMNGAVIERMTNGYTVDINCRATTPFI